MASSRNSSKTGGLRYLWIPGRKRSHPKGRFDSTNKRIHNNYGQKRSEPWSLGGSKGHKDLLKAEPDGIDSSPSISSLVPISCAAGVPTIAVAHNMPALAENKFAILSKLDDNDQLPTPPKEGDQNGKINNHVSASDLISNSVSNHNLKKIDEDLEDDLPSPPCCQEHNGEVISANSPLKKHLSTNHKKPNSNNRPEVDINSIESASECKLDYSELDLPDGICDTSLNETGKKKNKKKKKKNKNKNKDSLSSSDEDDDKVVKCLYYTLMCCECTIS